MSFLFPRWDMLILWRVYTLNNQTVCSLINGVSQVPILMKLSTELAGTLGPKSPQHVMLWFTGKKSLCKRNLYVEVFKKKSSRYVALSHKLPHVWSSNMAIGAMKSFKRTICFFNCMGTTMLLRRGTPGEDGTSLHWKRLFLQNPVKIMVFGVSKDGGANMESRKLQRRFWFLR